MNATMTRGVALCRVAVSRYRLLLLVLGLARNSSTVGSRQAQSRGIGPDAHWRCLQLHLA